MTLQLKKELRTLRPAWLAALALVSLPSFAPRTWVPDIEFTAASWLICAFVGGVLLGSEALGREFALNTFQGLLSHPTSRTALWRGKLGALASALATVLALGLVLFAIRVHQVIPNDVTLYPFPYRLPVAAIALTVLLVGGAASGLFWVLLTRQGIAAFWLASVSPPLLCGIAEVLLRRILTPQVSHWAWLAGLPLIALASTYGARRLFQSAQDLGVGSLELGGWFHAFAWRRSQTGPRTRTRTFGNSLRALIAKEIGL